MKNTYYIAYGSNLNLQQMARRCPTAKAVGTGRLIGYRLRFRGPDGNAVEGGEPHRGGSVPVLLWRITAEDESALDVYEGFPRLYIKEMASVKMGNGEYIKGMIYIMNDGRLLGKPSRHYLEVIRQGYDDAGFDEAILRRGVRDSSEKRRGNTMGVCPK